MSISLLVESAHIGYGENLILNQICFAAESAQNVGIIGVNGSGKSTLLRCIAGAILPVSGHVSLGGQAISSMTRRQRARTMAILSAEQGRPNYFTTLQLVLLGRFPWLSWMGHYSAADKNIAKAALEECGIRELENVPVVHLSSGQYQLAALARTLAQIWEVPHAVLLLDELTANLDLARKMEISLLLDKWRRKGHIIIHAMHDCNLAALFCTHLLGLKGGRQLFFGSVNDVFTKEQLSALYDWPLGVQTHPDTDAPQIYPHLGAHDAGNAFGEGRANMR